MDLNKLFEVYEFAKQAHESINQKRKTGEGYITHPIAVAEIAKQYGADQKTIHACLLHDVIEDTNIKLEEIAKRFGQEVAFLVYGVTKAKTQEKTFEKIENCIQQDKRVIFVKLVDRIHNIQTMDNSEKFKETWEKYKISTPKYVELGRQCGYNDLAQKAEELIKCQLFP